MFKLLTIAFLILGFTTAATADGDHTPDVCSSTNSSICAHLGHMSELKSNKEAQFVAHITSSEQVTDFKVVLWMPEHNHGSSPVMVTQSAKNKYTISKAVFVMAGQWEVRLQFTAKGSNHVIAIPLKIAE